MQAINQTTSTEKMVYQYRSTTLQSTNPLTGDIEILLATDYPLKIGESIQIVSPKWLKVNRCDGSYTIVDAERID